MIQQSRRQPARRPAPQRGQIAVMTLFLFIMLVFTGGVMVNVMQAVTRKIQAQMVCDAAAFTGATYQAKGLNALTKTNRYLAAGYNGYWWSATQPLYRKKFPGNQFIWPGKKFVTALRLMWEPLLYSIRLWAESQNIGYAGLAYLEARKNADHNLRYLFGVADVRASSILSYGGNYWVKQLPLLGHYSADPIFVRFPAAGFPAPALTADSILLRHLGVSVRGAFIIYYLDLDLDAEDVAKILRGRIDAELAKKILTARKKQPVYPPLWINNKKHKEELRFYWVVQLPETPAMFMPSRMSLPPVTAVGSAKPYGGRRGPNHAFWAHDPTLIRYWIGIITSAFGGEIGNLGGPFFRPQYQARLCPTTTDFILHFYLFGPQYYRDNALLPSLWTGVLH